MSEKDVIKETRPRMEGAVEDLRKKLATIRTGRAAVSLLDSVTVDYYGTPTPLNQMASVHAPEPNMLTVQAWDQTQLGAIEKAIRDSDLGVSPSNDGVVIRINLPQLTEERRREYVKVVKHMAEEGRVAVRNIRRDVRKHLEAAQKDGEISQDDLDRAEKELEKVTHEHVDRIDGAVGRKEDELLEV